jgi:hypothetical protein
VPVIAHRSSWLLPRPPPGEGHDRLRWLEGPPKTMLLPMVVRCRKRQQDVAPVEGLVYERPQRYLLGAL